MQQSYPVKAALGVDNAYVLVDRNGKLNWNLKGKYNRLDELLKKSVLSIEVSPCDIHKSATY
jgi:hypothetical protein